MSTLTSHSIDAPQQVLDLKHGHIDLVQAADFALGRLVYEPGWRWSEDVKPLVGTDSCQLRHKGFCLTGRLMVVHDDGTELVIEPGDVIVIEPGHDAWTLGDEPCVLLEANAENFPWFE